MSIEQPIILEPPEDFKKKDAYPLLGGIWYLCLQNFDLFGPPIYP